MRKLSIILFMSILFGTQIQAQKESNWWFFGQANYNDSIFTGGGIEFTSGAPMPVVTQRSRCEKPGGTSSVSDPLTGNLLFYSDGLSVWNKQHKLMQHGDGLMSGFNTVQGVLIVPNPASPNKYYVFTNGDADHNTSINSTGFRYSEVDMSLNGGLGAVDSITKNTLLFTNNTEQLSAVKHSNGVDWWVMIKEINSSNYYCYLLSSTGISAPVISSIGTPVLTVGNAWGQTKFSPDGTKYAIAMYGGSAKVFDFNNSTGILSNDKELMPGALGTGGAFGLSFSCDSKKLYVMQGIVNSFDDQLDSIFQYDLIVNTLSAISSSKTFIGKNLEQSASMMQLASDGKIYMFANQSLYSVISNPNLQGMACNFSNATVAIRPYSYWGLPQFPDSYFNNLLACNLPVGLNTDKNNLMPDLLVYPNPSSGKVKFSFVLKEKFYKGYIEMLNSLGELVLTHEIESGESIITLDVSNLNNGIYVYNILLDGIKVKSNKISVVK